MPFDQEPNRVDHLHNFAQLGSGLSCWAACTQCGEHLQSENGGALQGSRAKVGAAITAYETRQDQADGIESEWYNNPRPSRRR